MLNRQGLDLLLATGVKEDAPAFIIYCENNTERLSYTCDFIFNRVLKVNYLITHSLAEFQNASYFKINYSREKLPGIVQIIPAPLLFETGISETKPSATYKNDMVYFFTTNAAACEETFQFDLFSAVFYFISRLEEWQPFEKDRHQRFEAKASLLFGNNFHLKPVVDLWIMEFKKFFQETHGSMQFPPKQFQIISTLDIDNLFAYKNKGVMRTLGACLKDAVKFDFWNLRERIKTVLGKTKDPFDIYEEVSEFCAGRQIPLICFFLFRTGTPHDRTVNPRSAAFKKVIDILKSSGAFIGLHPSYDSAYANQLLSTECGLISEHHGGPVSISRQHFLRFDIRTTPGLLMQNGIVYDATMGYASAPGFRAGTSHPFYYFDFSKEKKAELLFLPFCAMDGAYLVYEKTETDAACESMLRLAAEIKNAGGFFTSVYHERSFSNHLYPGFGSLYKNLHLRLKEL